MYVTETGMVYHRDYHCTYLELSIQMVPASALDGLRNASQGKYYPCSSCRARGSPRPCLCHRLRGEVSQQLELQRTEADGVRRAPVRGGGEGGRVQNADRNPLWLDVERLGEILTAEHLICLAFLLGISVYDIWFRRISGFVLLVAGILAAGCTVVKGAGLVAGRGGRGALAGAMLLLTARLTREAVGYGDGWLVTVLGLYSASAAHGSAGIRLGPAGLCRLHLSGQEAAGPGRRPFPWRPLLRRDSCFSWRQSTRDRSGRQKGACPGRRRDDEEKTKPYIQGEPYRGGRPFSCRWWG